MFGTGGTAFVARTLGEGDKGRANADEATQDIVSYQDYLFDKPDELFFALSEYFALEADNPDEDGEKFEEIGQL